MKITLTEILRAADKNPDEGTIFRIADEIANTILTPEEKIKYYRFRNSKGIIIKGANE